MIDIRLALEEAATHLERLEAEILLGFVLTKNRAYLYSHPEQTLTEAQLARYRALLSERQQGKPIAYLLGKREFWSLELAVNEHTLIPRHETELLVELALSLLPNTKDRRVLDLGTGSGAIALAIAKERPHWQVHACDRSPKALEVAMANAKTHQLTNLSFFESDWFSRIPPNKYHAILSNPPYLAAYDPHLQQGDLQFEPDTALVSSQDGLADLQYIIQSAANWLMPQGLLLLEHGFEQKQPIQAILGRSGFTKIQCWQDFQGLDRVSGGWISE